MKIPFSLSEYGYLTIHTVSFTSCLFSRDMVIGVNVYSLVSEATKGAYVWLDGQTNEEVHSKTRFG
jgi:hypothetical protein